ncbi:hypothetical protein LARI1_G009171, partial [Lachnellula arida]
RPVLHRQVGLCVRAADGQAWYTKGVPQAVQTAVAGEVSAIDSAASQVLGTATSKGDAAPRQTGLAVAGVVGVVGMVAAVL